MPGPSLEVDAFVLAVRPSASDGWRTFGLLSAEQGPLLALQRLSRRASSASGSLDLFDEARLILESSNQGRTWFVREARLLTRHPGLGGSYEALQGASALARVIDRNAVGPDSRAAVVELLRAALAAFAAGVRPDIVYLKSLYRFARGEGYPVKEAWLASLPAPERETVSEILSRPLAGQSADAATVSGIRRRLEDYLRAQTEILID